MRRGVGTDWGDAQAEALADDADLVATVAQQADELIGEAAARTR